LGRNKKHIIAIEMSTVVVEQDSTFSPSDYILLDKVAGACDLDRAASHLSLDEPTDEVSRYDVCSAVHEDPSTLKYILLDSVV